MKHVIIGNGVAGTEAALAIRKGDEQAEITIISESSHLFYYRPRLIEYLAGEATLGSFTIHKQDFYEKMNIKNALSTEVTKIIPAENQVVTKNGSSFPYDKLLLASGARCFIPRIEGVERKGIFAMRSVGDADEIREYAKGKAKAVVIGGGLQGLETAYSLTKLGLEVSCVEIAKWLLPRQLDADGAGLLQRLLEEKGLSFVFPDFAASFGGKNGVEKVTLKSGRQLDAEVVVICAGIRTRNRLAQEAGLKVNKGIVVNDHLQTSAADVYAAGDVAEHNQQIYGLWPAAKEQGKAAGLNMAGQKIEYTGTVPSSTLKVTGIDLYSAGDFNEGQGRKVFSSDRDGAYKRLVLEDGRPIGAIVVNDAQAMKAASEVFAGKAEIKEFKKYF
jgi:nitrite reductase (NADH) large subunit